MRYYRVSMLAVLSLLTGAAVIRLPLQAAAPGDPGDTLNIRVSVADDSFRALTGRPVMVSVIRDGEVVAQKETNLNSNARFPVPAGLYDVRLEGDGMVTLTKRGIHVFDGRVTEAVGGPMHAGQGAHVVEFAAGGLSREEVAARLAKLEAAVAALQRGR